MGLTTTAPRSPKRPPPRAFLCTSPSSRSECREPAMSSLSSQQHPSHSGKQRWGQLPLGNWVCAPSTCLTGCLAHRRPRRCYPFRRVPRVLWHEHQPAPTSRRRHPRRPYEPGIFDNILCCDGPRGTSLPAQLCQPHQRPAKAPEPCGGSRPRGPGPDFMGPR